MINLSEKIYSKIKSIMDSWQEEDIYAISFFVYNNDSYEYRGYQNVSYFAISYNTESDCEGAKKYSEKRWNYAFWRQDEFPIINPDEPDELIDLLFDWYKENGIENIGYEDNDTCYDEKMHYIGKGPVGHYELLMLASQTARRLQQEGYIAAKFGKIPIIIHGLEYAWYDLEATENANPNGEADAFLKTMKQASEPTLLEKLFIKLLK